ncbi:CapA family protein [Mesorhizobium sp. M0309]|uniref:CapA family protein n=1 Tax=unclassified Mesorhizobium TaxID=325217 RepID=UPI00040FF1CF|nr:CapA family protein [Mesorhizobium sp. LSHC414A00]
MATGSVYVWEPCDSDFTGGRVHLAEVELPYLSQRARRRGLRGRYVDVISHPGMEEDWPTGQMGEVSPDEDGNFSFQPSGGGVCGGLESREAGAGFGQVNVYYHISMMSQRINDVLRSLGVGPLPKVRAIVNARRPKQRPGSSEDTGRWVPVKGVRYRYPARMENLDDFSIPLCGELLFGPGHGVTAEGWLPRISGGAYLCDPSHDAGMIYQAFGLHVVRHTADVQADRLRTPRAAFSRPGALEYAVSTYLAASMLSTPHVWCWHARHDAEFVPAGSLANNARIDDDEVQPQEALVAQAVAGAIWDLHKAFLGHEFACIELVVGALLELGRLSDSLFDPSRVRTIAIRSSPRSFASCLLHADRVRSGGLYERLIREIFEKRGIGFSSPVTNMLSAPSVLPLSSRLNGSDEVQRHVAKIRERFAEVIIPDDGDLIDPNQLELTLSSSTRTHYHLAAIGDVMTGMRMRHRIRRFGPDYCFAWVRPILSRCALITGNLEGPFSSGSEKEETTRNHSYKVDPKSASVLRRAGFAAMTVANNHIQDCGRDGVIETLDTLEQHHIRPYGGGRNQSVAHDPAIFDGTDIRVGLLGYYWNRRTAAHGDLPGSAQDLPEMVERDLARLRPLVDRIAVMVHWGVPYQRQPSEEDRMKAQLFIDMGADAIIGHHPHILQPVEIYKDRPILYSVGNFAFGSGNSKGESILPCFHFGASQIDLDIYPVYVQNRDPRLDYQPKVMGGAAGRATIDRLLDLSPGLGGAIADVQDRCLKLSIPSR